MVKATLSVADKTETAKMMKMRANLLAVSATVSFVIREAFSRHTM
jgi:hypothetical protein